MILVTGGTGLVGAHLLYKLVSNDNSVRAIYRSDRKLDNVKKVFSYYNDNVEFYFNKIEWVKADLNNIPSLTEAFINVSYVYHCAAFVSFEPDKYYVLRRTNIEGTANIVNLSIANNIKKICYVSSVATLGDTLDGSPITENTHWNPEADNNVYAITKYGAEMEIWRGTQEGLNAVVVNPGVILGGGLWRYGSGSLFKRVHNGLKFYTNGNVGLVDVKDVVNIMIQLMESKITNERFLLIAEALSYKEFFTQIAKNLNVPPVKKEVSPWLLQIVWRTDWLMHKVFGKRRKLTKQLAATLFKSRRYDCSKVKQTLNFEFIPIKNSIAEVSSKFLKDVD